MLDDHWGVKRTVAINLLFKLSKSIVTRDETDLFKQRILLAVHSTPCDTHSYIAGGFLNIAGIGSM